MRGEGEVHQFSQPAQSPSHVDSPTHTLQQAHFSLDMYSQSAYMDPDSLQLGEVGEGRGHGGDGGGEFDSNLAYQRKRELLDFRYNNSARRRQQRGGGTKHVYQ
jgi:hypothetical protein